jgi:hypothetical protein
VSRLDAVDILLDAHRGFSPCHFSHDAGRHHPKPR